MSPVHHTECVNTAQGSTWCFKFRSRRTLTRRGLNINNGPSLLFRCGADSMFINSSTLLNGALFSTAYPTADVWCLPFYCENKSRYLQFDSQAVLAGIARTLTWDSVHRPLLDRAYDITPPMDPRTCHPPQQWAKRSVRRVCWWWWWKWFKEKKIERNEHHVPCSNLVETFWCE